MLFIQQQGLNNDNNWIVTFSANLSSSHPLVLLLSLLLGLLGVSSWTSSVLSGISSWPLFPLLSQSAVTDEKYSLLFPHKGCAKSTISFLVSPITLLRVVVLAFFVLEEIFDDFLKY